MTKISANFYHPICRFVCLPPAGSRFDAGPSAEPTSPAPRDPSQGYSALPSLRGREMGSWTPAHRAHPVRKPTGSGQGPQGRAGGLGETKTQVVVPVVGVVPVPVRGTHVPRVVVPGTAPDHALGASRPVPLRKIVCEKIRARKPEVSACAACPIQL